MTHRADHTQTITSLSCGLCQNLLVEPITLSCGHTFCRGCINRKTMTKETCSNSCCEIPLSSVESNLITNIALRDIIELLKPGGSMYIEQIGGTEGIAFLASIPLFLTHPCGCILAVSSLIQYNIIFVVFMTRTSSN